MDYLFKIIFHFTNNFSVNNDFSIPHAIAIFRQMLIDAGADLSSVKSFMGVFPEIEKKLSTMDVASQMQVLEPNINLFLSSDKAS